MGGIGSDVFVFGERLFNKNSLAACALNSRYRLVLDRMLAGKRISSSQKRIAEELHKSGLLAGRADSDRLVRFSPEYVGFRIVLGEVCNLRCRHCFVLNREHVPKTMDMALLYKTLSQTFPYGRKRQIKYHLFGGEPLMMRKHLRAAVRFIEAAVARGELQAPAFTVTTNGTMIRAEDISFFLEHGIGVGVSVDGPREANDFIRGQGTYDLATKSLGRLKEAGVNCWFLATPTENTLESLPDFAESLIDKYQLKSFTINTPFDGQNIGWSLDGSALADSILECYHRFSLRDVAIESAAGPAIYSLSSGMAREYPCSIAGNEVMASISVDGRASFCAQYWGSDLFPRASTDIGGLGWSYRKPVLCLVCPAEKLCGGPCPINFAKTGRADKQKCRFYKRLLRKLLSNPEQYLSEEQIVEE